MADRKYTDEEIEDMLAEVVTANTNVGLKDAELAVFERMREKDIKRECKLLRRAGVSKVVLKKGDINKFTKWQINEISEAGLHPVIGISKDTTKEEIRRYIGNKKVNGFRLLEEGIDYKVIELIKESGKEISYKIGKSNIGNIARIDSEFKNKVIFVVEAKEIKEDNEAMIKQIKELATQGRISLYLESDEEDNFKKVTELVEKIFGKGAKATKTMISVGKAVVGNSFGKLFKKDIATISFSEGYEIGYEEIFSKGSYKGEVSPEEVVNTLKGLLSDNNMSIKTIKEEYEIGKLEKILTPEFELKIRAIMEDKGIEGEDKVVALRQYVIGSLVAYVEKNIGRFYKEPVDMATMNIEVKKQIVYRIIRALVNGYSVEDISEAIQKVEIGKVKTTTLADMVKEVLEGKVSQEIAQQWNKTDMLFIGSVAESDFENIKVLLEDNIKPVNKMSQVTVDVLKGMRATLSAA